MNSFPEFMKDPKLKIASSQQNTLDIEGYYYQGANDSQVAFWECHSDQESKNHTHDSDEYMVCLSGEYIAFLNGQAVILRPGDELHIPKGTEQSGKCKAGTRTIHVFGGLRIKP